MKSVVKVIDNKALRMEDFTKTISLLPSKRVGGNVYFGKYENLDLYSVMNTNIGTAFWFCLHHSGFWKVNSTNEIVSVHYYKGSQSEILCIIKR